MHILAPTEDLADEALGRAQRDLPRLMGRDDGIEHLARSQQLEVQRRGEARMIEPRLADPHGILVGAKCRQAMGDEVLERHERLFPRHWPIEMV